MVDKVMYAPQAGSPATILSSDLNVGDSVISVQDVSVLPEAPNMVTLTGENVFESIVYEAKDETNNELTQITRAVQGTEESWSSGSEIKRTMTAQDIRSLQDWLLSLIVNTGYGSQEGSIKKTSTIDLYTDEGDVQWIPRQSIWTDEGNIVQTLTIDIYTDEGDILQTSTSA